MSLEELLASRVIYRIEPDPRLAAATFDKATRDVATATTLSKTGDHEWALAIAYNAMLTAGRAAMFHAGFRPSSVEGHVAVVRYLEAVLRDEAGERVVMIMNGMRKKRHQVIYGETSVVSERESKQALEWARELIGEIKNRMLP